MQKPSQNPFNTDLKATIVGAGFSGLSIAYFLLKNGYQVKILEKNNHVAGLLQSPETPYGIIEHAANGLINSQELIDICSDIGLDILYPSASSKKKYLFNNGKMTRWPFGIFKTISTIIKIFKFKRNKNRFKPIKLESFSGWVNRVFSQDLLNQLVEPAFQGVYATYANNLSATLVTKNLFKEKSTTKNNSVKRQTVSFSGGMNEFCSKLSDYLTKNGVEIQLNCEATNISPEGLNILTCNPRAAGKILKPINEGLAKDLMSLNNISIAKVSCFIKNSEHSPEGFGCLFPKAEGFNSLGVLFDSSLFPTRYNEHSLHTWILGEDLIKSCETDDQLTEYVTADIKKLWNKGLNSAHTDIKVWKQTLPLYDSVLETFIYKYDLNAEVLDNLYLFGNYTGDLGLSQLLIKAKKIATRINYEQTK